MLKHNTFVFEGLKVIGLLCDSANCSQIFIICFKLDKDGATKAISSALCIHLNGTNSSQIGTKSINSSSTAYLSMHFLINTASRADTS